FAERAGILNAVAKVLDAEQEEAAQIITREMGKPLKAARAEVAKCAATFRYYARHGEAFLADEPADARAVKARQAYVRYQPLGPVLAVMPWNFPLFQVTRFAAPGVMAGNVVLLKHASNVPQTALYAEDVFDRAGAPRGVFQTLLIGSDVVERLLRDRRIRAVTLTGSSSAGAAVAKVAGEEVKKTVLELGGSDPFVVLPSADLEAAVNVGVAADMRMFREAVFGPVAQFHRVGSVEEALELANITEYGLGSNVWTTDPREQQQFIEGFEAGLVFVNGATTSYPEMPFGGVKT